MDEASRILGEQAAGVRAVRGGQKRAVVDERFDEEGYLRVNPDVTDAIRRGEYGSGRDHYVERGFREGRPSGGWPAQDRNVVLEAPASGLGQAGDGKARRCGFESLILSASGGLMLVGWIDDTKAGLDCIRVVGPSWQVVLDATRIVRLRRPDVEEALGRTLQHSYGVLAFAWLGRALEGPCVVEYWTTDRHTTTQPVTPRHVSDIEQRGTLLTYLANAGFFGNKFVEGLIAVGRGIGQEIVAANRAITSSIVSAPYVERFSQSRKVPQGSIVVVLYGKPEFMFLQHALYSGLANAENYEFIFVSNSPSIAETLLREARRADLIYGLPQTVVVLPDNAGFGAANNIGVNHARSNRILIVNPDVFPRDPNWARRHTDLVGSLSAERCRLFGVPMYYDDGSLMHGGMYFELDRGLSLGTGQPHSVPLVRVEHYGKGAPPETAGFLEPRPVPAVGGAFMSCDRAWYEALSGFTEDYVFGHYEDADLCLKSLSRGTAPWIHDIRMWHLEGKGSTRLAEHEGGAIVNRWLFASKWGGLIEDQVLGRLPRHPLLRPPMPTPLPVRDVPPVPAAPVAQTPPLRPAAPVVRRAAPRARPA